MLNAVLAGLFTGLMLGLTGAGGSILTLPALIAIVGLSPQPAVGASLISVGLTAATGLMRHLRAGHVVWRAAAGMAGGGAITAAAGGYLGRLMPGSWLMTVFGFLMLLVAWRMGSSTSVRKGSSPAGMGRLLVMGAGVGLLSGILGIGGGFLIVPVLVGPGGLSMQAAVGTALAVITVNATVGLAGAMARLGALPWAAVLPFVVASLIGGQFGAHLASRSSAGRLTKIFAALVLLVGIAVLVVYAPRALAGLKSSWELLRSAGM